jgi:16S rRNA (guanine966-N2)-methyltransferase
MVRAALFSVLGPRVAGASFLDLFAGSGAVGIEAWSRGAARVCWVERSRRVLPVLRKNVHALCGGDGVVVAADAFSALRQGRVGGCFDLVFADPPYGTLGSGRGKDLLAAVREGMALSAGGLAILEMSAGEPLPRSPGWNLTDERRYGDTRLAFFVQEEGRK